MLLTASPLVETGGKLTATSRNGLRKLSQKSTHDLMVWAIRSDPARHNTASSSALWLAALERIVKQNSKTSRVERNKCRNSEMPSLPAQARQHAPAAIAELVRIIENTRSDAARLAAICILCDRGLGKPPKPLDIAIRDRVKVAPPPSKEELERWTAIFEQRIRTPRRSMDCRDDAALEPFPGSTGGTPKTEGEG